MAEFRYPVFEYDSLDQLCSLIHSKTKGWTDRWYRGEKSKHFSLLPKLFRKPDVPMKEGYIAHEFRRRAHSRLKDVKSPFDWLCAMQHFGVPTRLLDWTESLSVALFFSVSTSEFDEDVITPTLWVLDPGRLYGLTEPNPDVIPIAITEEVAANADIAFQDNWETSARLVTQYPIPVAPNFLFERLAMQNGTFTIHGKDQRGIEELIPVDQRDMLLKFVPHRNKVEAICNCINLVKPCRDAIFPDLEGLRDHLA
ncbi:MAG: FRG domain-containing protein [Rhodomicrobium sp.]